MSAEQKTAAVSDNDECTHQIIMKDMCAACGKDLRPKDGEVGQRTASTTASVSMIHHVPELLISDSLAKEIGKADEINLLNSRKLVLLVDLDQTIIHTTNRPFQHDPKKQTDITRFSLGGATYHTKLRPHTLDFLTRMASLFELHIVTYGQRQYAHKIADILDPEHKLFGYRILSRDELYSATHKTRNLKSLFPTGDNLVVIIDDRSDVWQFSPALIQIKPYRFFKEVGDINAPRGAHDAALLPADIDEDAEHDTILDEIARVLTNIHKNYYALFEQQSGAGDKDEAKSLTKPPEKIPDVKTVIAAERSLVLKGCVVLLSGIVPMGAKLESSPVYQLATQFGAEVITEFTEKVTHVISAKWGTNKVHLALRNGVHTVTIQWLYACVERWKKVDESEYRLTENSMAPTSSKSKSSSNNQKGEGKVPVNMPSIIEKETLDEMENEVDEALSDEDDSDDKDDSSGSGSEDSAGDGESADATDIAEKKNRDPEASTSTGRKRTAESMQSGEMKRHKRMPVPEAEGQGEFGDLDDEEGENGPHNFGEDESGEEDYGDEPEEFNSSRSFVDDEEAEEEGEETRNGAIIEDEEEDREYDDMAALIERQMSHDEGDD